MAQWTLRPAAADDYPAILALADAAVPFDLEGNRRWLRYRQAFDDAQRLRRHYVATDDVGDVVGYGALEQQGDDVGRLRVYVVVAPSDLDGVGDTLYRHLWQEAQALLATRLWAREYGRDEAVLAFFAARGFRETGRLWEMRLTPGEARLDVFRPRLEAVAAAGVHVTTLAALEPASRLRLFELAQATSPQSFTQEAFFGWLERRAVRPEAYFIAVKDDSFVGHCVLTADDGWPGALMETWTAVRPAYKRQGITLSLRVQAIEYARRHGYDTLVGTVDHENFTMLALNEKLGFQRAFAYVTQEVDLTQDEQ